MSVSKYGIIVHAGTSESWTTNLANQQTIEDILNRIAEMAGSQMAAGARAVDVVQDAVAAMESCELFNAGKGAVLNEDKEHELEAAIVDGASGKNGAVACVRAAKHPIHAARAVLDGARQKFLVGPAADDFASQSGLEMVPNAYFTTQARESQWETRMAKSSPISQDFETVGAVALDIHGGLAAAGSTGGLTGKMEGRIGDTSVLGAGIFADEDVALVCGVGEDILSFSVAARVAALKQTRPLDHATRQIILRKVERTPTACAIIAIDSSGQVSIQSSGRVFLVGSCTSSRSAASVMGTTLPLFSQHTFYRDSLLAAGFTRYPTTPGQVVAALSEDDLLSMSAERFLKAMSTLRGLSLTINAGLKTYRSALSYDGGRVISLIPLHGLSHEWSPVVHEEEEYHEMFPGYLTSKNGPKISNAYLHEIQSRIARISGIKEPFDYRFDGDSSDQNVFARIVRGDLPQWRVWEDSSHVAFLTPFGNTPGYTVLVPRRHLGSDIFRLDDQEYSEITKAAYTVAQHLKTAFDVERCGMFFEGYEIDYAHIKLIPVHQDCSNGKVFVPTLGPANFHKNYEGYLTTQFGPLASDLDALSADAANFRILLANRERIVAPKTWQQASTHSLQALQSPWYKAILTLQDALFQVGNDFFHERLGYKYILAPVTTDSISSPMGLGSDSLPVNIKLHGQNTYLADSMQFALEYALRLADGLKGVYYVGCSFRGEDHDKMHLNQFYHTECELPATLDDGIEVAEGYVTTVASALLKNHANIIRAVAGDTYHIIDLLALYKSNGYCFPRISLGKALSLPEISSNQKAWDYAVSGDHSKGITLTRVGERILIEKFGGAVWLTEMDHMSVPFYQAFISNTNRSKALCADLLIGLGEVLGLGQRHADVESVREALKMHQVPEEPYKWYLDLRDSKAGGFALETTGWGLGMERFFAWILQHDDIRDMAIIPRLKGMKFEP